VLIVFKLIPWKKRNDGGSVQVRRAEPSRQDLHYHPLADSRDEFEMLWNRLFDRWANLHRMGNMMGLWDDANLRWNWNVGWEDKQDKYELHAELPGFEPEDFEVNVSGNTLTVRAEHRDEQSKKGARSYQYGAFSRSFTLPSGVDAEAINARYYSGVLRVVLPKTERGRGKRIAISAN
jgi:HSP20 family protein